MKQMMTGIQRQHSDPSFLTEAVRKGTTGALALLLALLPACHKTSGPGVIATVGDQSISKEELTQAISRMKLPDKVPASVPSDVLNRLIERTLITQEAEREGLDHDPAISEKIRNSRDRILRRALVKKNVDSHIHVTETDVKNYFDKHRNEIKQPGYVVIRQVIIPDMKTAKTVEKSLRAPHGFMNAIHRYKGGPVGKIFEGTVPPQFVKYFFGLPPGKVTGPLALKDGVHFFKVDKSEPGKLLSFDEAKSGIAQFLTSQQKQDRYQEFLNSLRAKTKISINQKRLGEVMGATTPTSAPAPSGVK